MIDIIIVCLYLIILLVVGYLKRARGGGFKSFAKAKGSANKSKMLLVATIFVSSIGGGTTFGLAEKVFAENLAYSYGLLLTIPIDILIAFFIVPRLNNHKDAETVGDIVNIYYGQVGRYIAGIAAICVSVGFLAAQISVSGHIFEYILNVEYFWGVVISYTIVVIYTTIGGLKSVLFTNQIQFFAMLVAIPIISVFGIYEIGFENFMQNLPMQKISVAENPELLDITIGAALGFVCINLLPTFIQRAILNKDVKSTKNAIYVKSVIYAIFLVFITINGLLAYLKYPEVEASLALPFLIDHIIPTGIQGIVVAGLLASVMSTADSDLNITSVTLVKDFLVPIFSLKNQSKMLKIARILNIIIGSLAIFIALYFTKVVDLIVFMAGFWGPVILPPLIFALFGITISKKGLVLAAASGISSFVYFEHLKAQAESPIYLKGVFIGTMVNLMVFLFCWIIARIARYLSTKKGN